LSQWICQQNIELFLTLHAASSDEHQRSILSNLLTQEKAKLTQLVSVPTALGSSDPQSKSHQLADPRLDAVFPQNGAGAVVTHYRCYFFRQGTVASVTSPCLFEAAEDLMAGTDDEARIMAETIYSQRRNRVHSYELWEGDRLVQRQLGSSESIAAT
jgi:hypothetical protein